MNIRNDRLFNDEHERCRGGTAQLCSVSRPDIRSPPLDAALVWVSKRQEKTGSSQYPSNRSDCPLATDLCPMQDRKLFSIAQLRGFIEYSTNADSSKRTLAKTNTGDAGQRPNIDNYDNPF
jgi:hypothetical protein